MKHTIRTIFLSALVSAAAIVFASCGNSAQPAQTTADTLSVLTEANTTASEKADDPGQTTTGSVPETDEQLTTKKASEATELPAVKATAETTSSASKTLVVYFSATGTTKAVAERIAAVTGADIYEIIPSEPYSAADLNWNDSSSRTTKEMNDPDVRPGIASADISLDGYSTVYIGYPIWWGDAPRIMSTFVRAHSFDGITVIPFCTSSSSGIGGSGRNLAERSGSGNWLTGGRLESTISESQITDWINGMN